MSQSQQFAITYDYRCPFARNANEGVIAGLKAGHPWEVTFLPFSLDQAQVAEGELPVWHRAPADRGSGVLALEWGLAVREHYPDRFQEFHIDLFAARHDRGLRIDDETVVRQVADRTGLDPDAVAAVVAGGEPLDRLATEHTDAVEQWEVFGVPTFISGGEAVFVRLMERGRADDVAGVLDMLAWARLNEFKRTRLPS